MPATAPVRCAIELGTSSTGSVRWSCDSTMPSRTLGSVRSTSSTWARWAPPAVSRWSDHCSTPRVRVWRAVVVSSTTIGHWSGVVGSQLLGGLPACGSADAGWADCPTATATVAASAAALIRRITRVGRMRVASGARSSVFNQTWYSAETNQPGQLGGAAYGRQRPGDSRVAGTADAVRPCTGRGMSAGAARPYRDAMRLRVPWSDGWSDAGLAALTAAVNVALVHTSNEPRALHANLLADALAVVMAVPILYRRRWPLGVLIATAVLLFGYYSTGFPGVSPAGPLAVPLYTAAVAGRLRWALGVTGFYVGAGMLVRFIKHDTETGQVLVSMLQ